MSMVFSKPRLLSPMLLFALGCFVVAWMGFNSGTERYLSPDRGIGYALGIIGGSLMLLLLLYSARKRAAWLGFIGTVPGWFQTHMVMGLLGPLLILFHSNFQLGATNSNVALYCMLVVSVSGLFGRYFYGRIHVAFQDRQATFAGLRSQLDAMARSDSEAPWFTGLALRLKSGVTEMTEGLGWVPEVLKPPFIGWRAWRLRRDLSRFARHESRSTSVARGLDSRLQRQELMMARRVAASYIDAARKVVEFKAYEQMFSLWHMLHLPLFFMLLAAGIVHVIAVHVY
ncbi:MAG: hypothetical protein RLZZ200_775 [Pseudomonadota bacterium]